MEISEVRIKLVEESSERLRAFCSITLDGDFVIRDLKIIDGVSGPFVAMPSRKLADRCPRCGCKNHLRAKYCNDCGLKLNENRAPKDTTGRAKLHADVAHPINAGCRERIQTAVVKAYEAELERSKQPGYKPQVYDDFGDEDVTHLVEEQTRAASMAAPPSPAPAPAPLPREAQEPAIEEEPTVVARRGEQQEAFSDYNSLIADLKKEAAVRHGRPERPEDSLSQAAAPAPQRTERGPERGGERGPREGGRQDRGPGRGDRGGRDARGTRDTQGGRRHDRRDDRRGGPRDDRRRDEPRRQESTPAGGPPPAPATRPPAGPEPAAAPPPSPEEDEFGAGL